MNMKYFFYLLLIFGLNACTITKKDDGKSIFYDELYDESNYIVNISVYPDYRGNNIAKKLIRFACNYYLENKLIKNKQITLDVELNNKALKLYELIGFERSNVPSRNGKTNIVMGQDASLLIKKIDELLGEK